MNFLPSHATITSSHISLSAATQTAVSIFMRVYAGRQYRSVFSRTQSTARQLFLTTCESGIADNLSQTSSRNSLQSRQLPDTATHVSKRPSRIRDTPWMRNTHLDSIHRQWDQTFGKRASQINNERNHIYYYSQSQLFSFIFFYFFLFFPWETPLSFAEVLYERYAYQKRTIALHDLRSVMLVSESLWNHSFTTVLGLPPLL